ncbi:MAG: flippase [Ruminococcus sp.]|nr:flippase [Ruminococcus sp.]
MNNSFFNNKIIKNASWIVIGKVFQSLLGLIVNMLTARYLGPSNYGIINYAASLVAFVAPIMNLGFSNVLVQEIILDKKKEGVVLGSSILLSLLSAVACIIGVIITAYFLNSGEKETIIVCSLYSILLIFQAADLIQYWFQANYLSKYSSIVSLIAYAFVAVYKVILLLSKRNIYWFAISNTLDYMLISVFLIILYYKLGGCNLSFSWETAKSLFSKSKHYIVSSLMVTIFAQTDKIMLKLMISDAATGHYAAAVSCASVTSFVFSAIIDSFRPAIFESKKESEEKFNRNMSRLYCVIFYLSLFQCIGITILAEIIIRILYGNAYIQSVNALRVIVWYTTYAYFGSVRNIWILAENKQKYLWIINLSGAILNILLNLSLIPICGIVGAAIASLITQFFTNVIVNYLIKPIRYNNVLMLNGLKPRLVLDLLKK